MNELDLSKNTVKKRRLRTIFDKRQLELLEIQFQIQQYMVGQQRRIFAQLLGLNELQVKVWFQNKRIKWRRQLQQNVLHIP
ncbi:homeobox domain-containing protein [Ditylenchus destructor]|nr:homeobox domain-containing protein [Ditylenchus destructor]